MTRWADRLQEAAEGGPELLTALSKKRAASQPPTIHSIAMAMQDHPAGLTHEEASKLLDDFGL